MEEKLEKITENLYYEKYNGKEIYILGTAHVLDKSKEEVEKYIEELDPDTVCVELCESRYNSLVEENRWKDLDIVKVIKEGKAFLLLSNMILSSFQRRIGKDLSSQPGAEMISAVKIAKERGKNIELIDRDVNITLKRAWSLSKFSDKIQILEVLMESIFSREKVKKEEVEELLANSDILNNMMQELASKLPKVKEVLIDERDFYIANKIKNSSGNKILAVVGKGHINGILKYLSSDNEMKDLSELLYVPENKKSKRIFAYLFGLVLILLFALGFFKSNKTGIEMILAWTIASGITTSISALLVMAHPVTIILSWLAAPVKAIFPPISAGIFLAPIEAYLRKPRVIDFENLGEDITTFKGFLKNRVTRILLVFVAVTIGAIIGHTIALIWMTKILTTSALLYFLL
jgi:pheromone shutdown-related protein TraB